jgi:hypothetical protein
MKTVRTSETRLKSTFNNVQQTDVERLSKILYFYLLFYLLNTVLIELTRH